MLTSTSLPLEPERKQYLKEQVWFHLSCFRCLFTPASSGRKQGEQFRSIFGQKYRFSSLRNSTLLSQLLTDEGIAWSSNEWERNKSVWSCSMREGTEESAKPLCFSRVRGTSAVRNAVRCTERFWLHRIWSLLPSFSVTSNLSHVICSNLTTLHGQIRNQVTNREPLCFIRQLLCLFLDSCLCVAQMPFVYFRTLAFRITQGHYNSSLFALWKRLMWCAFPCLPKRKRHFYFA